MDQFAADVVGAVPRPETAPVAIAFRAECRRVMRTCSASSISLRPAFLRRRAESRRSCGCRPGRADAVDLHVVVAHLRRPGTRQNATTAAFDAAYALKFGRDVGGAAPDHQDDLAGSLLHHGRQSRTAGIDHADQVDSMVSFHAWAWWRSSGPMGPCTAAEAINTSRPPKITFMRSTAACICSRSRTSARRRSALPPACSISSFARSSPRPGCAPAGPHARRPRRSPAPAACRCRGPRR